MSEGVGVAPPDAEERRRALDPARSFLVQAPAGSGKTYLLTQRFLRLLGEAEKPDEIVAITFTNAAAAEMRSRILSEMEKAEAGMRSALPGLKGETGGNPEDADGLASLARRALERAEQMGWKILDLPEQLRITTIDAFCRSLALQSPLSWGLLSRLGGKLDVASEPDELYRRAARRTLGLLEGPDSTERKAVEAVLLWRDNHWKDVEDLIVEMLKGRNRWHREFVFARDGNWEALRKELERPFFNAFAGPLEAAISTLAKYFAENGHTFYSLRRLAKYAREQTVGFRWANFCESESVPTELPKADDRGFSPVYIGQLEKIRAAYIPLGDFLLTNKNTIRKNWTVKEGFPPGPKSGKVHPKDLANQMGKFPAATTVYKDELEDLTAELSRVPDFESSLAAIRGLPPLRYPEAEWELLQKCFAVLRRAAGELQLVFAESGSVDFTEVAQMAQNLLAGEDGLPTDFAMRQADGIRHLLVDEFQDTSRMQHQLLSRLIAAWPEREGRSCFCVGDPMQSIYGFREAEVELFERTKRRGLSVVSVDGSAEPFLFETVRLKANFRTVPSLVIDLNERFARVFAEEDASGVEFAAVEAAREAASSAKAELHLAFTGPKKDEDVLYPAGCQPEETRAAQAREIVALIQEKLAAMEAKRAEGAGKYRIAVLGKTRPALLPVALALSEAGIGYRAIELVPLSHRPEVVDALALARALLNPVDRTAWLGVLRAPWCGLSLEELHLLTSADEVEVMATPVPALLESRLEALRKEGRFGSRAYDAATRVRQVLRQAMEERASAGAVELGTWLEGVWKALGGGDTVSEEARENLRLLWATLDKLPEGEVDLLGPGLDAAMEKLFALPAPEASGDFGVQLMTIHKAKGLEFEVVIVPGMEAEGRKNQLEMLSWLERGLTGDENGAESEFLIAPFQAKGLDAGAAKKWVDEVKRERERQEQKRVLYVAATRARDELHLFARPQFRIKDGSAELCKPKGLLATAWPAFGEEVETRFEGWAQENVTGTALELAAAAGSQNEASKVVEFPVPARPGKVRRLPEGYVAPEQRRFSESGGRASAAHATDRERESDAQEFERPEGGLASRLLGVAVHSFLEQLSRADATGALDRPEEILANALPGVVAAIRGRGFPPGEAKAFADKALELARKTANDPVGRWILAPHPKAETETRWTGEVAAGLALEQAGSARLRNLRPDRVFFDAASPDLVAVEGKPHPPERPVWWIIDYKTTAGDGLELPDPSERQRFLSIHRDRYSGQLTAYAQVLRHLIGDGSEEYGGRAGTAVWVGIYYPTTQLFDFWEV